jgi:ribosomal protein S18 acetylase RimI-like enzyme
MNTGAPALYRRHGFVVVGETPERLLMQWVSLRKLLTALAITLPARLFRGV